MGHRCQWQTLLEFGVMQSLMYCKCGCPTHHQVRAFSLIILTLKMFDWQCCMQHAATFNVYSSPIRMWRLSVVCWCKFAWLVSKLSFVHVLIGIVQLEWVQFISYDFLFGPRIHFNAPLMTGLDIIGKTGSWVVGHSTYSESIYVAGRLQCSAQVMWLHFCSQPVHSQIYRKLRCR